MLLKSLGLWMDQGTGKTITSLKILGNWYKRDKVNNLLILAPKSVLTVWEDEIEKFLSIPYTISKDIKDVLKPKKIDNGIFICLAANYEILKRFKGKSNKLKNFYDMVIADESHRIKNPNSIQSKQAYFLSRGSSIKLALSGTPKGNSDFDFFSQYRFINDEIFGAKTKLFRDKYFDPCGWMGHDVKLKESKKKEFYSLVNQYSFRVTKQEALELPPLVEKNIWVELSPKTQKIYDKLKKESLIEIGLKTIVADLSITLVTKLQQICCGFIYDEDKEPILIGDEKLKVLKDLLQDHNNEKVVIFCKYTWEINTLKRALSKYRILIYDGNSSIDEWKKFKTNKYDILITQIKKGGTGLNLQNASVVIFFSLSYSYIDLSQAKDRVYRNGQLNKVTIYYLLAKNTIEKNILKSLNNKKEGAKAILEDYRLDQLNGE